MHKYTRVHPYWRRITVALLVALTIGYVFIFSYAPVKHEIESNISLKTDYYFIAALFRNNEEIIYDWIKEILAVIDEMDERKVFVSIVENGDSHDRTREALETL